MKKNSIYSLWIKQIFGYSGNGFFVQYPSNIKGGKYMTIGNNFIAGDRLRLECWDTFVGDKFSPNLTIGSNVVCNYNIHIGCINKVIIGDNVLLGSNILITDHQHGFINENDIAIPPVKRRLYSLGPVIIEDEVWIGENVSIMPNVTIGKGCIIGANSVVTKCFPAYSVIAGVPAKIIKNLT